MSARVRLRARVAPSYGRRLPGIEGLRALAASSVLLFHVWIIGSPDADFVDVGYLTRFLPDLAFGVTLFFTLSGFLLYRPFVSALLRAEPRPGFRKYLRNRFLRIAPAYVVIFLLSALVLQAVHVRAPDGERVAGSITSPELLVKHLLLVQHYEPGSVATGIGPAWSLAVEVVFYLALPLLVALAFLCAARARSRRGRRLAALSAPLLLLVVGLAGKATATFAIGGETAPLSASWHEVAVKSFFGQADLFAFGMIVAILRVDAEDGLLTLRGHRRVAVAAAAVGAYLVTAKLTGWDQLTASPFNTLMALGCALLVALVVLPGSAERQSWLVRALEWRPLVAVGLVSYSLFLWSEPVILWLREHDLTWPGAIGFLGNAAIAGTVAFGLAVISYRFVELPALRRKFRTSPATPSRSEAAASETSSAAP